MSSNIQKAAELLRTAQSSGTPCPPVRTLLPEADLEAAYTVQDTNIRLAEADGRRIVGRKIGLTAKAVQKQLGVDQPDYGLLFADMEFQGGEIIPWGRVLQPKAEAEIALVLEQDLAHEDTTLTELIAATAYALPAIEVVGSRVADWDISILDTIADNASSGLYVLGRTPKKVADVDLQLCGMAMFRRGEPISVGAGAACLGHPLNAALWLARKMAAVGRPLAAGDVILTGALGPMVAVKPGDRIEARIEGLGSVIAAFGQETKA